MASAAAAAANTATPGQPHQRSAASTAADPGSQHPHRLPGPLIPARGRALVLGHLQGSALYPPRRPYGTSLAS